MLGEVLEVVSRVLTGGGGEVEVVDLVDFTDREHADYASDVRWCVAYMFATTVVCLLFGVSGASATTNGPLLITVRQTRPRPAVNRCGGELRGRDEEAT
jgi:hypothetical protein